jgi:hypothetical protein
VAADQRKKLKIEAAAGASVTAALTVPGSLLLFQCESGQPDRLIRNGFQTHDHCS